MNKQQWQNRIDELEKELAELKANQPKREPGKRWEPRYDEWWFYIGKGGDVKRRDGFEFDFEAFDNFNIFETEEEAEFARERTKIMRELDLWAMDSLGKVNRKYYVYYDIGDDKFTIGFTMGFTNSPHVFESKEIAKKAIKAIGEERLKNIILG